MLLGAPIRENFPFFKAPLLEGKRQPVYLDNAASSQKPKGVIDALTDYLSFQHANVHRGAYQLSVAATERFEAVRVQIAEFLGARSSRNIIFTRGTTDSINLAAFSLQSYLKKGQTVLLTLLEHHSNIVPWQILAERQCLSVQFADILDSGSIDLEDYKNKLNSLKPAIVAFTALANSIGTLTPVRTMVQLARESGALVLVDAAQYAAHQPINVTELDCDFLAFSGHKLYGPTGVGVLYASDRALDLMSPVQGGGEMISTVTISGSTWADIPHRFEAGTPSIAEVIALEPAIRFLADLHQNNLKEFEDLLFKDFLKALSSEPGVKIYGPAGLDKDSEEHTGILSFTLDGVHPHDLASIADSFGVQIRAGHHCAQPLMTRLGLNATARLSLGCYSDRDQIPPLLEALAYARKVFA